MKRWTIRIVAFLLLGAIVNVAVAWACALWSGAFLQSEELWRGDADRESIEWWNTRFPERDAGTKIVTGQDDPWGHIHVDWVMLERASAFGIRARNMKDDSRRICGTWAGWPILALSGEFQSRDGKTVSVARLSAESLPLRRNDVWPFGFDRCLPLRPIWPGFAINTVFYAAVLWLLFAGPFVLRRLRGGRRIRRGLCPKCAYDLRGTPEATSCPECGAAVRPNAAVAPKTA